MSKLDSVSREARTHLERLLVSTVRVAKAYEAAIETVKDETERSWLEDGLRNSIARAEAYKRALDQPS